MAAKLADPAMLAKGATNGWGSGGQKSRVTWFRALVRITQPVSWDGRIVHATPLHLAASADRDRPDYQAATPQETDDDADDASPADENAEDSWEDGPEQEAPEPDR
jgi:hypothetical protein